MFRSYLSFLIIAVLFSGCFKKYVPPPKKVKKVKNVKKVKEVVSKRNIKKIKKSVKPNIVSKTVQTFDNIPEAITYLANQLLENISYIEQKNNKIILTSFVDLDNFSKTTPIGRLLSESLIDELFVRKFKVLDYRTQIAINVNRNGEFILSRDITKLTNELPYGLILLGTYSKISNSKIFINIRILDNSTFDIVSTAKAILEVGNCKLLNSCEKIEIIKIEQDKCNGEICY